MATSAVLDASAVVRALVDFDPAASDWLARVRDREVALVWPALVYAEVANTAARLTRAGALRRTAAHAVVETVLSTPADVWPLERLALGALEIALTRSLSAYDACYVVLAETLDAPLVTADRRLAAATPNAVLISG